MTSLGIGRKSGIVDVELRLEGNNPKQKSLRQIVVTMSSPHRKSTDTYWRQRCYQVFRELCSHLVGEVVSGSKGYLQPICDA